MEAKVDGRMVRWTGVREKHCSDILRFLAEYSNEHGYMPSRREIAIAVGVVVSSVNYYLAFMIEDGVVEVGDKTSRAIRITEKGIAALLPVEDGAEGAALETT